MGKYRRYKNRLEMFLSSEKGKRVLNFLYSWGASIVILGALFKLLHLPYGNQILFIAMITESFVFFISAFEHPNHEYHWEDVFPVLKSKNPLDRPDFSSHPVTTVTTGAEGATTVQANIQGAGSLNIAGNLNVSEEDTKNLAESIKKLSGAAEQLSKMAELTEATQHYLQQISSLSQNMERFSQVTHSLNEVSANLLNSYKGIADQPEEAGQNAQNYWAQMEQMNRNVASLNQVYEMQLQRITAQMESMDQINNGLRRIREMYDGSVMDSSQFRGETEKMTRQLAELNQVYARLLQAMTVNMGYQSQQPGYAQPQPGYQQPAYPQQPPYGYQQPQAPYTNPMK